MKSLLSIFALAIGALAFQSCEVYPNATSRGYYGGGYYGGGGYYDGGYYGGGGYYDRGYYGGSLRPYCSCIFRRPRAPSRLRLQQRLLRPCKQPRQPKRPR